MPITPHTPSLHSISEAHPPTTEDDPRSAYSHISHKPSPTIPSIAGIPQPINLIPSPITSTDECPGDESADETITGEKKIDNTKHAEIKLSQSRKWFLLFMFSVAQYLDVASATALFVFSGPIGKDLGIKFESSTWIVTAYSVTFTSSLMLWGRVSDLYSAKPVFVWGFFGLGVSNLIISFMPDQYSFLVLRALSGIAGAATIPSAFRLILAIFEPAELKFALMLFGLSGAIAGTTSIFLSGAFGYITATGQMSAWRWFFRMICIVIVPFAFVALALVPKTTGDRAEGVSTSREKFKRLDLIGCFLILMFITLLILGLTLGVTYGFNTVRFYVPFFLSWPVFWGFFIWEATLPETHALIPSHTWKIPNLVLLLVVGLVIYGYWGASKLPLVQRFESVYGETPFIAAIRFLPQAVSAALVALTVPRILTKLGGPRIPIATGMILGAVGYSIMIYTPDGNIHNGGYWRYYFPAFIVGSAAIMVAYLSINITVMTSINPKSSGVISAVLQVALQLGGIIALSIQAGILTLRPGGYTNYANLQASYWWQVGWCLFNLVIFLVLFKPGKGEEGSEVFKAGESNKEGEDEKRGAEGV